MQKDCIEMWKSSFIKAKPILLLLLVFFIFNVAWSDPQRKVILEKRYEEPDNQVVRHYEDVILDCGKYGKAHFTISLPKEIPPEGLPCIMIVGGLMTGRDSLRFIPDHGQYALVAYEYSDTLKKLQKINVLWNLYAVRKAMIDVPPQLIEVVKYLQNQPWMGKEPVDFMGYSFGSIFVPNIYVRAQEEGIRLGPGVMAYGGAGIHCLLEANVKVPKVLKSPVATIAAALFKPIDPLIYAPRMKGDFLIINGIYDSQIPFKCAKRLQNIIPEPKTVINLETEHMHPDNTELTLRLINISRSWLEEKHQVKQ